MATEPALRGAWKLVAVALAGVLVAVVVLGGILWRDPLVQEVAHAHGVAPPPVPGPARDTLIAAETREEGETTPVTVEVVDFAGEGIEDVEVRFAPDGWDGAFETAGRTDAEGRLTADVAGGRASLELARAGQRELRSRSTLLTGAPVTLRFRLARLCPGPVRISVDEAADGMQLVDWSGDRRVDVADGDEVDLPRRRCGSERLALRRPGMALSEATFQVEGGERVDVHFPASSPRAVPTAHGFSLTLECLDCPELVEHCEGAGTDWRCTCTGPCTPTGKWPESLFDWRYVHQPLIRVEPGDGDVFVALPDHGADVVGRWAGPVPCTAIARDEARGVAVEGECLSDGSFFVADLLAGPWTVTVAWDDQVDGEGDDGLAVTRSVEVDGEVDLGTLSPD